MQNVVLTQEIAFDRLEIGDYDGARMCLLTIASRMS